jgi:hypothetical protein
MEQERQENDRANARFDDKRSRHLRRLKTLVSLRRWQDLE